MDHLLTLGALVFLVSVPGPRLTESADFVTVMNGSETTPYFVSTGTYTINDSRVFCEKHNATLVILDSEEKFNQVVSLLMNYLLQFDKFFVNAEENQDLTYTWANGAKVFTNGSWWVPDHPKPGRGYLQLKVRKGEFLFASAYGFYVKPALCEAPTNLDRQDSTMYSITTVDQVSHLPTLSTKNTDVPSHLTISKSSHLTISKSSHLTISKKSHLTISNSQGRDESVETSDVVTSDHHQPIHSMSTAEHLPDDHLDSDSFHVSVSNSDVFANAPYQTHIMSTATEHQGSTSDSSSFYVSVSNSDVFSRNAPDQTHILTTSAELQESNSDSSSFYPRPPSKYVTPVLPTGGLSSSERTGFSDDINQWTSLLISTAEPDTSSAVTDTIQEPLISLEPSQPETISSSPPATRSQPDLSSGRTSSLEEMIPSVPDFSLNTSPPTTLLVTSTPPHGYQPSESLPLSMETATAPVVPPRPICNGCRCQVVSATATSVSDTELKVRLEEIRAKFTLDKTKLSKSIRKLYSAEDYRLSSCIVGAVSLVLFAAFLGSIVCSDIIQYVRVLNEN